MKKAELLLLVIIPKEAGENVQVFPGMRRAEHNPAGRTPACLCRVVEMRDHNAVIEEMLREIRIMKGEHRVGFHVL